MDCAVNCGIVITPGSRKCALFCTLPWHDWKTMVPWIGHFNIKCACTSQGKGVLSITFSELSEAALTAPASLHTHLQLYGNTRLNLLVHIPTRACYILRTFESAHSNKCAYLRFFPLFLHFVLTKVTLKLKMQAQLETATTLSLLNLTLNLKTIAGLTQSRLLTLLEWK